MTEREYYLQEMRDIRDELSPDIDENGLPDSDAKLHSVLCFALDQLERQPC